DSHLSQLHGPTTGRYRIEPESIESAFVDELDDQVPTFDEAGARASIASHQTPLRRAHTFDRYLDGHLNGPLVTVPVIDTLLSALNPREDMHVLTTIRSGLSTLRALVPEFSECVSNSGLLQDFPQRP